jgi:serine/threonine protein kinase HipA of HipAB toxin-antitoxin module
MKHQQQYQSTRLLLPQSAAAPADRHPSPACCNRRLALTEIAQGQSLVTQLRAIVLPALQADQRAELVAHMFQSVLDCSSKAMAELQLHHHHRRSPTPSARRPRDDDGDGLQVDDKKRVKRISSVVGCKEEEGVAGAAAIANNPRRHQHKRRYTM